MRTSIKWITPLVFAWVIGCSARSVPLTDEPSGNRRVAKLEQAFRDEETSKIDRIRVAAELVRLGVRDRSYSEYIDSEVNRALAEERKAAEEWIREQQEEKGPPRSPATAEFRQVSSKAGSSMHGPVTRISAPVGLAPNDADRAPDPTNLVPIVVRSMTAKEGDTVALEQLRLALDSQNVLLSAEAALGLAKIKDVQSIPRIEAAAQRFEESLLFARALVYFNDRDADLIAARLLNDAELFRELQQTAQLRQFDPYYRK